MPTRFLEIPRGALGRIPQLMVGLLVVAAGATLMVDAGLGLGPWDVLHQGISDRTGLQIGTVGIVVGFVVFLAWIPLGQRIGLGTLINAVTIGAAMNLFLAVPFTPEGLPLRIAALVAGDVMIALGGGLYIGAGLGTGPRDGLMTGLVAKGYPLRTVRTVMELVVLVLGWILGGTVGVGTVLFALTIGPLLHFALHRVDRGQLVSETQQGDLDAATSGN